WGYALQQFATSACSGTPAKDGSLYFTVARLTLYTSSSLTTTATSIAPGARAYVRVDGLGKVNTGSAVGAETDWSATWIKPDGATSCANTGANDRPDSSATGSFPSNAADFLQYRPNTPDSGDQWNFESKYETRPCADTTTTGV